MLKLNKKVIIDDLKHNLIIFLAIVLFFYLLNFFVGSTCPFRFVTGLPCPGCGLTRSFLLVARGRLAEATRMHAFWIPITIWVIVGLFNRYMVADKTVRAKVNKVLQIVAIVMAVLMLVYFVYRMIAIFPNEEPMLDDHLWFGHFPR